MRRPTDDILPVSDRLTILPLDVTDPDSIRTAFAQAGDIDVLVNNAGFGAAVPVELIEPDTARALFETNTLGTLATMQAILPVPRTPPWYDHQCHVDGHPQAAAAGWRLSGEQGSRECADRKPGGRNEAVWRARAYRPSRSLARDTLWQ
jgi:NAD(P)-dependent dehydrogenase (short-subunit alcohol dehydrogenase family)